MASAPTSAVTPAVSSAVKSVIVDGARTPMGRLLGSLKGFTGAELGGFAIKAALERAGVRGDQVQYVVMGQVLQAGAGQLPARKAAALGRHPDDSAFDAHQQGLSVGLTPLRWPTSSSAPGEFDIVVAGGMESMTNTPHVLPSVTRRHQVRQRRDRRRDGARRTHRRLRWPADGCLHRGLQRALLADA